ncbi:MAG TPA: PAS domain S-box protein [Bacteroidota bacterium]|nr:PAS domain S-box protein [Bacteroidota bacterium]
MARILVVEDERVVAKDIQRSLVRQGHDVPVVAASAEEAIAAAGLVRPDLALMDVTLRSPLDGIQCAAVLRERFQIPVVYLTAHGDRGTLEAARRTGPVGYILKPFEDQTLFASIEVALQMVAIDASLRARESWLSAVLSSIGDGVVTIGPDGAVTLVNPAACRMTGLAEAEAVGKDFSGVIRMMDEGDCATLARRVRDTLGGMGPAADPIDAALRGPRGAVVPVECTVSSICAMTGLASGAVVVIRDVTERKRGEEALRASEQKYRSLFENAVEGFFRSMPDGALVTANPAMARLLGYDSVDEMARAGTMNLRSVYVNPMDRERMVALLQNQDLVTEFEAEYRRRDGTKGWFSANIRGHKDASGTLQFLEGTVMDVTARKRAKEDLESREAYLRAILDNAPYVIWLKDIEGRYIDLNRALAQKCGLDSIEQMRGKNDFDLYPYGEAARLRNQDLEIMKTGARIVLEEGQDKLGKRHYTEKYKSVLKDGAGNVLGTVGFSRDITEMKEQENRLRKLSRAVEQSSSTIVITDTAGTIEYVNPRFSRLTGYTAEEAIGKNPNILKSGRTPHEEYERLWKTISAGGEWSGELQNRKKNGDLFWEYATISPIRDENGNVTHFVGIKEDITKRKEVEAELARRAEDLLQAKSWAEQQARRLGVQTFELRKAREEALRASRLKSEFVANMSHEIRTPMNGVLGMTGLLLDTPLDEEQREYAEIIRTSGEVLLSIVNDILDFSKIEAGKLDLEEIDFQLKTTLDESMDLVSARAREKGLELCCDIADGVPAGVRGDPGRVRQILTNLLSNAVKFTEQGEVEAGVTAVRREGDRVTLRFSVRDTGIGISEEERARLFKPFSQADGSTTRKHGGTGLGLVIAKQLVEMMGGEIGVASEKGKGSEFFFTLTLPARPVVPVQVPAALLRGVRALIVDDNATSRKILMHQLSTWEMRPALASSAEEALGILRADASTADPFRIALLDMQMPQMSGLDLARAIMADRTLDALRLMLLTSAGPESVREAQALGLSACLNKPVRDTTLHRYLEQILSAPEARHPLKTPGPDGGAVLEGTPPERARAIKRVLVAEDNPVNQRVAVKMLEKIGCRADVAANGKEAVEAVSRIPYDAVFMDCQMPEMDGFEATARIRKLYGSAAGTLVVAMTANALNGDRERCIASGMDDYLAKPVTQEALEGVLRKWEKHAVKGAAPRTAAPPEAVHSPESRFEEEKIAELKALAVGAEPLWFDTLVRQFLKDSSGRLEVLRGACRDKEPKTLEDVAHALKGSCATMGAAEMRRLAGRLQSLASSGSCEGAGPVVEALECELALAERYLTGVLMEAEAAR